MARSSHDHQQPDKLAASVREHRIDRAHRMRGAGNRHEAVTDNTTSAELAAADTTAGDDPAVALLGEGPHVHLQAEQLARLLADRLAEIDRREAQLHVLAADLDNQQRVGRLSLVEREQQLDRREAFLTRLESSGDGAPHHAPNNGRLDRFIRADAAWDAEPDGELGDEPDLEGPDDHAEPEDQDGQSAESAGLGNGLAAALDERQKRLDAIRDTLVEEHRRLIDNRRTLEDWARRQRDEIERQSAELRVRQQALTRQEADNGRWRAERAACHKELQQLRRVLSGSVQDLS